MEPIPKIIFIAIIVITNSYAQEQDCHNVMKPDQKSCTFKFQNISLFEIKNLRRANEIVCEFEGNLSNLRYTAMEKKVIWQYMWVELNFVLIF